MLTATIDDLIGWNPCDDYSPERIRRLANGRETFTAMDVLDLNIPWVDKLWVITRPELIDPATLRRVACAFVRRTPLADGRTVWDLLTDQRSRTAIEVAERYVEGKASEAELEAANAAANAAAAYAAYAAYTAADAAAYAADAAAHGLLVTASLDSTNAVAYTTVPAPTTATNNVSWNAARKNAQAAQEEILLGLLAA